MKLNDYMQDGANYQARAVLAYLQHRDGLKESWNDKLKCYDADIQVDRWHNCREQGYIVSLKSNYCKKQINIIFFEHRIVDDICAVVWEQLSLNPITIDTAKFGKAYKNKGDVTFFVRCGEAEKLAEKIHSCLTSFWVENN